MGMKKNMMNKEWRGGGPMTAEEIRINKDILKEISDLKKKQRMSTRDSPKNEENQLSQFNVDEQNGESNKFF